MARIPGLVSGVVLDPGLPPRLQWMNNNGYCGELSTVVAGLRFGQYFSQFDVRALASGNQRVEYLLGVNDVATAGKLKLKHIAYPNTCLPDATATSRRCSNLFLAWIKAMTRRGYAVSFAVYTNSYLFDGLSNPNAGSSEYDHIVSVNRIVSNHSDDLYYDSDIISFSDHGIWTDDPSNLTSYIYTYTFQQFQGNRKQANARTGPVYTLPSAMPNYGIAHIGPVDDNNVLLNIRLQPNTYSELPEIRDRSSARPTASRITLSITVSGLLPGVKYNIYKYSNPSVVPTRSFNANASKAAWMTTVVGGASPTMVLTDSILSSDMAIYRAVRADAPS